MSKDGKKNDGGIKVVARNKTAKHRYTIETVYEAGMALVGTEVKSLRGGTADLRDAFAEISRGEVFLQNCNIPHYAFGNRANHEAKRKRKLLLHKLEIKKLIGHISQRGYTLIPLEIYFKNGKAKISIGLAKGKKTEDRRQEIRKKDIEREMQREGRKLR